LALPTLLKICKIAGLALLLVLISPHGVTVVSQWWRRYRQDKPDLHAYTVTDTAGPAPKAVSAQSLAELQVPLDLLDTGGMF